MTQDRDPHLDRTGRITVAADSPLVSFTTSEDVSTMNPVVILTA